jgi:hypothetical protein
MFYCDINLENILLFKLDGSNNQFKYKFMSTGGCTFFNTDKFINYAQQYNPEFMHPLVILKRNTKEDQEMTSFT